jgi:hypothetical protein
MSQHKPELTKIGEGGQSKVYLHPELPDQVIKFSNEHERAEKFKDVKARFYLTRIFHLLFPDMIPNVHLEAVKEGQTRIDVDLIRFEEVSARFSEIQFKFSQGGGLEPEERAEFVQLLKSQQARLDQDEEVTQFLAVAKAVGLGLKRIPSDFLYSEDGHAVYVDRLWEGDPDDEFRSVDIVTMIEAIETLMSSEEDKNRALKWLERYSTIVNSEG